MATRFSDDLYAKVATIDDPSGDLAKYIEALGDMFGQVEDVAREDSGPVWLPFTLPAMNVVTGANSWSGYYSVGTRITWAIDPTTTYKGQSSFKTTALVADGSGMGTQLANEPIIPGRTYRWRGRVKGTKGMSFQLAAVAFAGQGTGSHTEFDEPPIVLDGSWQEVSVTFTAPSFANWFYGYAIATNTIIGQTVWFADAEFGVQSLSAAPHVPWSKITDPELASTTDKLLWLAQLAGVKVPVGLDATSMRTIIEAAESRRRGTLAYMVEVAQRLLTGTKTVYTHERVSDAYTLSIATKTTETPDSAAVLAALTANKPAGIVMTYVTTTGVIWDTPTHQWDQATTVTWDASLSTVP